MNGLSNRRMNALSGHRMTDLSNDLHRRRDGRQRKVDGLRKKVGNQQKRRARIRVENASRKCWLRPDWGADVSVKS
jgi:hypothetical protein